MLTTCPLFTDHCSLFTVHCPLFTVHCSLFTVHCPLSTASPQLFLQSRVYAASRATYTYQQVCVCPGRVCSLGLRCGLPRRSSIAVSASAFQAPSGRSPGQQRFVGRPV